MDAKQYTQKVPIGKGMFSTVYKAYDKKRNKTIVYKEIVKNEKDKTVERMIINEVEVLSSLKELCCRDIICYLDMKEDEKNFYIITEYLGEYTELNQLIGDTNMSLTYFLLITFNLIKGLIRIHSMGVAHRDIKPDNIMVNPITWEIKYIDFGLSCLEDKCNESVTVGTPAYVAPEVIMGNKPPSTLKEWIKADYWSLGMTILTLVLGENLILALLESAQHNPFQETTLPSVIKKLLSTGWIDGQLGRILQRKPDELLADFIESTRSIIIPLTEYDPEERQLITLQFNKDTNQFSYYKYDINSAQLVYFMDMDSMKK